MPPLLTLPSTGLRVPRATLLAIDDAAIPLTHRLALHLGKPRVRPEPVLTPSRDDPSAPDSLAAHFYGSVIHEGGKFRMWYYACHAGRNPDYPPALQAQIGPNPDPVLMGPVCYAESDDGIAWMKPKLGQLLFKGRRDHHALGLPDAVTAGAYVIRDDADPDPGRRYKMVYNYYSAAADATPAERAGAVRAAWSGDGLSWTADPRPAVDSFFELGSFFRFGDAWVMHGQKLGRYGRGEAGSDRGRQGYAHLSTRFPDFLPEHAEAFALPDPADPSRRGVSGAYDQVHLGVGAAGFGNVAVGLYGLWHNADYHREFARISCDFGLVVSHDGVRFREPVKGHVFLGRDDSPVTPPPGAAGADGCKYHTILAQANGILNVSDETRIYHGRWRNVEYRKTENGSASDPRDYYAEVALATLPRDRWGALALYPDAAEGSAWTAPLTLPTGGEVKVSLNAEGAAGLRVEIADERFALWPGFSGEHAGTAAADGIDAEVRWPGGSGGGGLASLAGQTMRLRVTLRHGAASPRLYAVYVEAT